MAVVSETIHASPVLRKIIFSRRWLSFHINIIETSYFDFRMYAKAVPNKEMLHEIPFSVTRQSNLKIKEKVSANSGEEYPCKVSSYLVQRI